MGMLSGPRAVNDEGSMRLSMVRSYGTSAAAVEGAMGAFVHILVLMVALMTAQTAFAQSPSSAKPVKIVVLGDSLSAGLGLSAAASFPERLQKVLNDKGVDVDIANAGVSGDTST